jgi:hypothetical protein
LAILPFLFSVDTFRFLEANSRHQYRSATSNQELVRWLLANGADPNLGESVVPLDIAANGGTISTV